MDVRTVTFMLKREESIFLKVGLVVYLKTRGDVV